MDELVKKIEQILNQFFIEEQNNRLSQFAMISLLGMQKYAFLGFSFFGVTRGLRRSGKA